MDKLKMETVNITQENIEKIGALFPNVITETKENGELKKVINFDKLKQELSNDIIDNNSESYDFTWVGKNQAVIDANTPIRKTLRPVIEDEENATGEDSSGNPYKSSGSKNFETTENLYIEGDNIDVLKLLQESYLNSIKMIYIDPPYNTGSDSFVYPDNYVMDKDEYDDLTEKYDEDGNILFKENKKANPRYHSDWCSMIYQRLKLAKNLLTDDGVIFISIDDNEVENLKKICSELYGEINFLAQLVWISGRTSASHFTNSHEYIICYAKNKIELKYFEYKDKSDLISDRTIKKPGVKNPLSVINFPSGIDFDSEDKIFPNKFGENEPVEIVSGILECRKKKTVHPVSIRAGWAMKDMIEAWLKGEQVIDQKGQAIKRFYFKSNGILQYEKIRGTIHPNSIISGISTKNGSTDCTALMNNNVFTYPKPLSLIHYLSVVTKKENNDIILDFFSGSATTAHAVMQLNSEDGGNRKFIMVQLPEQIDPKTNKEAYNFLQKDNNATVISEIGKERIRRGGDKIKKAIEEENAQLKLGEEPKKVPDIGFRVLKVDSTNMLDVYYGAGETSQKDLENMVSNIKDGRNGLDLLYGILIDWGLNLSSKIETLDIDGTTVYNYDNKSLIACLENKKVSETTIREIAKLQPMRVVFRDESFTNSADKINVTEIFKITSPSTSVKVI